MLIVKKDFSAKLSFVGAVIGASIGLGLLNLSLCLELGFIGALLFGFKRNASH
jgi:hypothetical protein